MAASVLLRAARVRVGRSATVLLTRGESRGAYQTQGGQISWLLAAAVGVAGGTSIMMYRSSRKHTSNVGLSLTAQKTAAYTQSGTTHPEAEAERLISATPPLEEAPPTPIVTTEMAAEAPKKKIDVSKLELPAHVPYVLVGAGTASFAAAKAIREADPASQVLIIGAEGHPPYSRPPLSKQLWLFEDHDATRQLKFKAAWSGGKLVDPFYNWNFCDPKELPVKEGGGVAVLTSTKVTGLDPTAKKLTLDGGTELSYDKCLLATGGQPRNLPIFVQASDEVKQKTSLYRTIPDYLALDKLAEGAESVLVVGGGFLGSELAVGLASRGRGRGLGVVQVFPEEGNLGLVLPRELCKWTTDKVKKEGVAVHAGTLIEKVEGADSKVKATLKSGEELLVDHVVVAVGLEPNTQLAASGRLETDPNVGGFLVNSELQACSDVWAAGDAACFYDPQLGRRRVEHHDHANVSGRLAGENMTGAHKRFTHQSMFWSDVGPEVGFEATGLVDAKLPTVGIWAKASQEELPTDDFSKGVVFYLEEGEPRRIVGVLTWNLFGKMELAKQVIADGRREADIGEIAANFQLHN